MSIISIFRGGYANLISSEKTEDWDEFVDLVTTPRIGAKNGDYFVRGFCDGPRCDENMRTMELIIVDGDQLLSDGSTCCPPQPVHEALKAKDITHVIYSSFSNDLVNNRHKWRVCVPCEDITDADDLRQGCEEIVSILQASGLPVLNVTENLTPSQPWFTPRCPHIPALEDFYHAYHDGNSYKFTGKVLDTAKYDAFFEHKGTSTEGCFSWDYVIGLFKAGTLHQGLKSACGWLMYTTNWADIQIKQHLVSLVQAICPDPVKVARACEGTEIDKLIKYCREKSGITIAPEGVSWKNYSISAADLKDKEFPPIKWAVDGIIPEGQTVLAGDPKAGKSLMAVDICSAIASGAKAFGNCPCVAGTAVYISLEDPERRVKDRILQQCDVWPGTFRLVTGGISQLGTQFYKDFDEMLLMWPDTRAIVIDTMQFIIPPKPNGISDYDHYYKVLDPLHRWALENSVAVICITHKTKATKQNGDNPFSGIIGSVAIQGTSDAMIMLSKNHAKGSILDPSLADGFLDITGREIGSEHMSLEFDGELMKWCIRGQRKIEDVTQNPNWLLITEELKHAQKTPKQISDNTGININTTRSCLKKMKAQSLIDKDEAGNYCLIGHNYGDIEEW